MTVIQLGSTRCLPNKPKGINSSNAIIGFADCQFLCASRWSPPIIVGIITRFARSSLCTRKSRFIPQNGIRTAMEHTNDGIFNRAESSCFVIRFCESSRNYKSLAIVNFVNLDFVLTAVRCCCQFSCPQCIISWCHQFCTYYTLIAHQLNLWSFCWRCGWFKLTAYCNWKRIKRTTSSV